MFVVVHSFIAMPDVGPLALFLVGFLGGVHCFGMCGGIVGALSLGSAPRLALHLAYNAGRIASYVAAGALAGAFGQAGLALGAADPGAAWALRLALFLLANLMLVALGLYLMGATRILAGLERLGQGVWQRLQPLGRRFLPARTVGQAFPLGLVWGWLPCGLVYGALFSALSSGSAWRGAGLMLAFGLGTLPNLLLAGLLAARLQGFVRNAGVRGVAGGVIFVFGAWGTVVALRQLV